MSLSIMAVSPEEQVTISMASIPERRDQMLSVVRTLLPYCDNFDLCLNGYDHERFWHPLLDDERLNVTWMPDARDMGARGKFYMNHRTPGYKLTVDDDILYPSDYVREMVAAVNRYRRKAIVGIHGTFVTYPHGRHLMPFEEPVLKDMPIHILGTGCMAYHTSVLPLHWTELEPGKIDDQVAAYAQDHNIPMIILAHRAGWARDAFDVSQSKNSLRRNTAVRIRAWDRVMQRNWRLFR